MAVTAPSRATFLESYPEFAKASATVVDRKLAEAARRTAADIYSSEQEVDAVCLKAAVLLSKTPEARKLRLVDDTQALVWAGELYELQRSATMGMRVF